MTCELIGLHYLQLSLCWPQMVIKRQNNLLLIINYSRHCSIISGIISGPLGDLSWRQSELDTPGLAGRPQTPSQSRLHRRLQQPPPFLQHRKTRADSQQDGRTDVPVLLDVSLTCGLGGRSRAGPSHRAHHRPPSTRRRLGGGRRRGSASVHRVFILKVFICRKGGAARQRF